MSAPTTGETWIVFDAVLWGGRDVGDNEQFWKPATILRAYQQCGDQLADVCFEHDGRESHGHFTAYMRPALALGEQRELQK